METRDGADVGLEPGVLGPSAMDLRRIVGSWVVGGWLECLQ